MAYPTPCTHTAHLGKGSSKGSKNLSGALSTLETSVSILTTEHRQKCAGQFLHNRNCSSSSQFLLMRRPWTKLTCGAWRLGKHLNIEMTVPFLPGEFRKQNACWKKSKKAGPRSSLGRTGMPASPIGSSASLRQ